MSYKDELQKEIRDLEQKILSSQGQKLELEQKLQQLRLAEFEEELRESSNGQQLLKG
jgi:predicted  nucleic acid-binding Zn-ribbon protein